LENEIFYKKIEMAIKNPTGQEYEINDVEVKNNTSINEYYLSYKTGLGENCFDFESEADSVQNLGIGLKFNKDLKLNFLVYCRLDDDCKVFCTIKAKQ
jgi:hypothetical protein